MAKAYTDIEQSEKLAEILPIESADMCYPVSYNTSGGVCGIEDVPIVSDYADVNQGEIPCWSLAALFDTLPSYSKMMGYFDDAYHCSYMDEDGESILSTTADTLIDACYETIIKLHEQKLI